MESKNTKQEDFEKILSASVVKKKNEELMKKWESKLEKEFGVPKKPKEPSKSWKIWVAILAFLALGVIGFIMLNEQNNDPVQMAETYIEDSPLLKDPSYRMRGNEAVILNEEMEAYGLLEEGEYNEAINKYESIVSSSSLTNKGKYYFALSLAKSNKYNKATTLLNEIIIEQNSYTEESKWLLGLVLASNNRLSESKIVFDEIVENKFYKHQEATIFLQSLENK